MFDCIDRLLQYGRRHSTIGYFSPFGFERRRDWLGRPSTDQPRAKRRLLHRPPTNASALQPESSRNWAPSPQKHGFLQQTGPLSAAEGGHVQQRPERGGRESGGQLPFLPLNKAGTSLIVPDGIARVRLRSFGRFVVKCAGKRSLSWLVASTRSFWSAISGAIPKSGASAAASPSGS